MDPGPKEDCHQNPGLKKHSFLEKETPASLIGLLNTNNLNSKKNPKPIKLGL